MYITENKKHKCMLQETLSDFFSPTLPQENNLSHFSLLLKSKFLSEEFQKAQRTVTQQAEY